MSEGSVDVVNDFGSFAGRLTVLNRGGRIAEQRTIKQRRSESESLSVAAIDSTRLCGHAKVLLSQCRGAGYNVSMHSTRLHWTVAHRVRKKWKLVHRRSSSRYQLIGLMLLVS